MRLTGPVARWIALLLLGTAASGCRDYPTAPAPAEGALRAATPSAFPYTEMGTLGGGESHANAVGGSGHVVGSSLLADGQGHAFLWSPADGMQDLGTLGGTPGEISVATDVNDAGVVVGRSGAPRTWRPVLRTAAGEWQDLGVLPGDTWGIALAINNPGEVLGVSVNSSGFSRAFLVRPGIGMIALEPPAGAHQVEPRDINDSSQIVGGIEGPTNYAFLRDSTGEFLNLGSGMAKAISNSGWVAGDYSSSAWVWDPVGGRRSLPLPAGADFVSVSGIDDAGRVVGAVRISGQTIVRAILWVPEADDQYTFSILADLQSGAVGINDAGRVAGSVSGDSTIAVRWEVGAASTRPPAPSDVLATLTSAGVQVSWTDASSNETSFRIQRAAKGPDDAYLPYELIGTADAGATGFTDSTVVGETTYRYLVQACLHTLCTSSAPSGDVTVPPPGAPTGVTARVLSATRVELGWVDPGPGESSFQVRRSTRAPDGTFPPYVRIGTVPAGTTSFVDEQAGSGQVYRYRIFACVPGSCAGSESKLVEVPLLPEAPTELIARIVSSRRLALTWTDRSTNESRYVVRRAMRRPDGSYPSSEIIAELGADRSSFEDTTVQAGAVYHYRVAACNAVGCSLTALPSTGMTLPGPPAAPGDVSARALVSGGVEVRWTDMSSTETFFRVQRSQRRADGTYPAFGTVGEVGADATSFIDPATVPGNTYRYRVLACRKGSCSISASAPVTAR